MLFNSFVDRQRKEILHPAVHEPSCQESTLELFCHLKNTLFGSMQRLRRQVNSVVSFVFDGCITWRLVHYVFLIIRECFKV